MKTFSNKADFIYIKENSIEHIDVFIFQSKHIILKQDFSSSSLMSYYTTTVLWVTEDMSWLSIHPNVKLGSSGRSDLTTCTKFSLVT